MKKVYVSMIADLLHAGHIKILKEAAKYGEVTVGLLTLKACGELNDIPYLDYDNRKEVLENLSMVKRIIPQESASYKDNLLKLKSDFVIHGDDWQHSYQKKYRTEVFDLLKQWSGELIEIPYSSDISEIKIKEEMTKLGITTNARQSRLRKLINAKPVVKILEVHNALSGLIAENASETSEDGEIVTFDGMWSSSLTDSTSKGKPDIDDLRESPGLFIAKRLIADGVEVLAVEPNIKEYKEFDIVNYKEAIDKADIVTFLVAHKEFKNLKIKTNLDFCGVLK